MSSTETRPAHSGAGAASRMRVTPEHVFGVGLTTLFIVVLSWPQIILVWGQGPFSDTDDAMRLLQVRDLLAGQGWFDLRQHRLDPASGGLIMHWTRLVDLPLAVLLAGFRLVLAPDLAERAARLAFTVILHVGMLIGALRLARTLGGRDAAPAALAAIVLTGLAATQFSAGRPDHHAPQLVLLLFLFDAALRALEPERWRSAALAGALVATSLSISVETTPYLLLASAVAPLRWVALGAPAAPAMRAFAAACGLGVVVGWALFAPGGAGPATACDAISPAFVAAGVAGAFGLLALSAAPGMQTPLRRIIGLAAVGALALAAVALTYPACLGHPYAAVDPLVRDLWLSRVAEATPLLRYLREQPSSVLAILAPPTLGALGLALGVWRAQGLARIRWMVMLAAAGAAFAVSLLEIRALSMLAVFAAFGAVPVADALFAGRDRTRPLALLGVLTAALVMSTAFWALVSASSAAGDEAAPERERLELQSKCRRPADYAGLAALPAGLVAAPIDVGPFVLAHTPHSVLAGPYHRNNAGNRAAIELLLAADPADAMRRAGVRYVVYCAGASTVRPLIAHAPDGLAARIGRGETIPWLTPLPGASSGKLQAFEVR